VIPVLFGVGAVFGVVVAALVFLMVTKPFS
jgi:hypothetical protein